MTAPRFEAHRITRSGVARVSLAGELDMETVCHLREAVAACLAEDPRRLCLDLTDVGFCDCSGVNALLHMRISALLAGVDLVVEGVGTQLARLLSLIGADDVFTEVGAEADMVPARRE